MLAAAAAAANERQVHLQRGSCVFAVVLATVATEWDALGQTVCLAV